MTDETRKAAKPWSPGGGKAVFTGPATIEEARKIAKRFLVRDADTSITELLGMELTLVHEVRPDLLAEYIKRAGQDRDWWESVRAFTASLLRQDKPLTEDLRLLVADVLEGVRQPPRKKPGQSKYKNYGRDFGIVWTIFMLSSPEIRPTRNPVSTSISACDIVADEMGMSYEAVASVRRKMQQRGKEGADLLNRLGMDKVYAW